MSLVAATEPAAALLIESYADCIALQLALSILADCARRLQKLRSPTGIETFLEPFLITPRENSFRSLLGKLPLAREAFLTVRKVGRRAKKILLREQLAARDWVGGKKPPVLNKSRRVAVRNHRVVDRGHRVERIVPQALATTRKCVTIGPESAAMSSWSAATSSRVATRLLERAASDARSCSRSP